MSNTDYERELILHYDEVHKRLISGNGANKTERPLPTPQRADENALLGILKRLQGIEYGMSKLYRVIQLEQRTKLLNTYPHNPQLPVRTVDKILDVVCREEMVTRDELCGNQRTKRISLIRMIVYYLASKWTLKSTVQIGHVIGNRDHTTILAGIRKIRRLRPLDADLNSRIWRLEQKLELLGLGDTKKSVEKPLTPA